MDRLIFEQANDMIERLDKALEEGTYDRQTGYDIGMAKTQIRELLGWIKLIEVERDQLDMTVSRLAKKNCLLQDMLEDDTLQVIRFD